MPRKKPKPKPKSSPRKKLKPASCGSDGCKPKPKPKPRQPAKRQPPTKMIIRNNTSPAPIDDSRAADLADEPDNKPLVERISDMGASHLIAGVGAGVIGQTAAVVAVTKAWAGPKTSAGVLMGAGGLTTGAGWYLDMDHVMAAGVGLTAAGALSMTNQLAADAYESIEKRAEAKRKKKEAEQAEADHAKKLAEARALLEAENKTQRNARHIAIVNQDDADADNQAQAA